MEGHDGTALTPFQQEVIDALRDVLSSRLAEVPGWERVATGAGYLRAAFEHGARAWELEIYDEVAYADDSKGRWDSDVWGRNPPYPRDRAQDFAQRLGRLLDGGEWFTPDDPGLPDRLRELFRKIL